MKHTFAASLSREGDRYVAQCLNVDIASQGDTPDAALANLQDALALHLAPPTATRVPVIRTVEVDLPPPRSTDRRPL